MPRSLQIFLAKSSLIFGVPWNRRCPAGGADEHGVVATFAEEATTMLFQVAHQRAPFHALTFKGSRITGPVPVAC